MLRLLRKKLAYGDSSWNVTPASKGEALAFRGWSLLIRNRRIYELALKLASIGQKLLPQKGGMISRLPPPFSGWTQSRDLRPVAGKTFTERWRKGEYENSDQ